MSPGAGASISLDPSDATISLKGTVSVAVGSIQLAALHDYSISVAHSWTFAASSSAPSKDCRSRATRPSTSRARQRRSTSTSASTPSAASPAKPNSARPTPLAYSWIPLRSRSRAPSSMRSRSRTSISLTPAPTPAINGPGGRRLTCRSPRRARSREQQHPQRPVPERERQRQHEDSGRRRRVPYSAPRESDTKPRIRVRRRHNPDSRAHDRRRWRVVPRRQLRIQGSPRQPTCRLRALRKPQARQQAHALKRRTEPRFGGRNHLLRRRRFQLRRNRYSRET